MSTFKEVNAVTRLALNSGKSSQMNMELIQRDLTTVIQIFNSRELMYISMKPLVDAMFQEPYLWILNQVLWTQSELDHLVNFSDLTTSFLAKQEQGTTGPKDTIQKVLNLLTQYSMLSEKKLKVVIASKDSRSLIHLVVAPVQVWEHF